MKKLTTLLCLLLISWGTQAQWTHLADIPGSGRNHPVTFSIDGKGYVFTGYNTAFYNFFNDGYQYDPTTDSWTQLNDFPGGERGFAYGASYDGKGYVGFGRNSSILFNDLWEYNPNTDTWTQLTPCPCVGRRHPVFVITDSGKLYAGMGDGYDSQGVYDSGFRDFWEYDIDSDTWSQMPDLPGVGRHHPFYFAIGNDVFAGFGHKGGSIFNDFYKFNSITKQWQQLMDFPGEARVAGTQFAHNGFGYILDGEGVDHQNLDSGEFYKYDPVQNRWSVMPFHNGDGLWAPGTFVIDDIVYLFGGDLDNDLSLDKLWAFDLDENRLNQALGEGNGMISLDPNYYEKNGTYQWLDCSNQPLSGENSAQIQANVGQGYKLVVNYSQGGVDTSDCFVATNISEIEQNRAISLYPNPAKDVIQIDAETGRYIIYNVIGKALKMGVVLPGQPIDIQGLSKGQYYLQYIEQGGNNAITVTFIKN